MTHLERRWMGLHDFLVEHDLSHDQVAMCRNIFFTGVATVLNVMAELNRCTESDEEFDRLIDELFDEAHRAIMNARGQPVSTRRH